MEKDTRVCMYRRGESRVFASPEAVPANEGWQDRPVEEMAPEKLPEQAPIAEPVKPKRAKKAEAKDE